MKTNDLKLNSKSLSVSFLTAALILTSFVLSSCAGNNNNNAVQACGAGYYYTANGCYPINGNGPIVNPIYQYQNGFYADNYSGTSTLRVTNGAAMREFFKSGMGVCDRAANNYGLASCESDLSGYMDMIIQFPPNKANTILATFIAKPRVNPYGNYQAQLPSGWGMLGIALGWATGIYMPDPKAYTGAYKNPLQLEMTVSAINNSQGFEARGYGDYWTGMNRTVVAIQVPRGKAEDARLDFRFLLKGPSTPSYQTAAQGTMTKCARLNCGL